MFGGGGGGGVGLKRDALAVEVRELVLGLSKPDDLALEREQRVELVGHLLAEHCELVGRAFIVSPCGGELHRRVGRGLQCIGPCHRARAARRKGAERLLIRGGKRGLVLRPLVRQGRRWGDDDGVGGGRGRRGGAGGQGGNAVQSHGI